MKNANENNSIQVEIVYASRNKQTILAIALPIASTVRELIIASNIIEVISKEGELLTKIKQDNLNAPVEGGISNADTEQRLLDILAERIGVFGKRVNLNDSLAEGDRVEIYLPLKKDPKQARRDREKLQKNKIFV